MFIFTFTSFGVILILGGVSFATIEVQIYLQTFNLFNLPLAGALSVVQLVVMALVDAGIQPAAAADALRDDCA